MPKDKSHIGQNRPRYRYYQPEIYRNPQNLLFPRPLAHQITGDIKLGQVTNSFNSFGLLLDELPKHTLITGMTGAGKTTIMRSIQLQLSLLNIPFLTFDLSKYGSRYIKHLIPELKIIRWNKEFFFNPLKPPPGVRLLEWLLTFCEITSEVFGLLAASKSLLIELVQSLYYRFDSEKTGIYPTIHDLLQTLNVRRKKTRSRVEVDYIDRLKNKIQAICITLDDVLNVQEGIPIDELLKYPVSLEFVGVTSSETRTWAVSMLMVWIEAFRTVNAHFGKLRHAIFYDEAAQAFRKQGIDKKENYLIGGVRRFRESGEALFLADQSIASLHDVLKSNIYTLIALNQSGPHDVSEIRKMMGLNPQQVDILNKLEPGQGIIKLAGKYPYPVLVTFPLIEPKYLTEADIDKINENDQILQSLKNQVKTARKYEQQENQAKPLISTKMKEWLMAVYHSQYQRTLTEIYDQAGFSAGTGSRIAQQSEKMGLVKILRIQFRKGNPRYPILLPEGYETLGIEEKKFFGKGAGNEHVLYQHLISEHFSELKPKIELYRKGKHIDVAIETNERLIAFEVAMTSTHEKENIEKDLIQARADSVIVACRNQKVREDVQRLVSEMPEQMQKKTKVLLVSELLNKKPDKVMNFQNGKLFK